MLTLKNDRAPVLEPQRSLPCAGEYDVLVVGGGIAGYAAGVAAARQGCKTLVVERESALGGLATLGHVCLYLPLSLACMLIERWLG